MKLVQKHAQVEVVVDATVQQVWAVVSDPTRVGEWSHECREGAWLSGARAAVPGALFRGRNRAGIWRWGRTCEVVDVDAPRSFVWRTLPGRLIRDSTVWRIDLEPAAGGTRIIQSFEVVLAPWFLDLLFARLVPTHRDRDARLAEDLHRIGEVALS